MSKEYKAEWYVSNRDRILARQKALRSQKKDVIRSRNADYVLRNIAKVKAARDAWREANPDANRIWARKNRDKRCASTNKRKAAIRNAIPGWANHFFIDEAYSLASLRTKVFGFKWHVDHVIPLQSKLVCGLHVENNLRVIPGTENMKKYNSRWPDMPNFSPLTLRASAATSE